MYIIDFSLLLRTQNLFNNFSIIAFVVLIVLFKIVFFVKQLFKRKYNSNLKLCIHIDVNKYLYNK